MFSKHLATYLNDHLAGAAAGTELLGYIASSYAGSDVETFAAGLKAEVAEDRRELERLMGQLNISQSTSRKASAWVAEKFTQMKLRWDDPASGGTLRLLEAVEGLSLGIEGKRLLWRSLMAASEEEPALRGLDYERLQRRAEDQRSRVEAVRLRAAGSALKASA